jgi:hypothetical protein
MTCAIPERGFVHRHGCRRVGALVALSPEALATFPREPAGIAFVSGTGGPADDGPGADVYLMDGPNG